MVISQRTRLGGAGRRASTTKPPDKGTGLGLALSSDIIRTHGGLIHVDSEPGEYTEMTITLPLVAPAHEAVAQDAADDDE